MGLNTTIPIQTAETHKSHLDIDPQRKLKLQKAVRDFESLFVQEMLKSMRGSIEQTKLFGEEDDESFGGDIFGSMFDMEISRKMSEVQ